ncbi:MAG: hypothetical protein FWC56_03605 [Phycisphaerae bacterium]|nr:hypothetical protein [Phycisphaerae bacterium]
MSTRLLSYAVILAAVSLQPAKVAADTMEFRGDRYTILGPAYPYAPDEFLLFKVELGYGDPSNTIGSYLRLWEPGIYDLSNDPGWPGFSAYFTNGVRDPIWLTIEDWKGNRAKWQFEEVFFSYRYPDLAGYSLTGAAIEFFGNSPSVGPTVQWVFYGTPEPMTIGYLLLGTFWILRYRSFRFSS